MQNVFESTLQEWFGVPAPLAASMKAYFKPQILKKEVFFMKTGGNANTMAFLVSGFVREYFIDGQGREVTKWVSSPGNFLTDIAGFLFWQPARWNLQALTDCQLLVLSADDYSRMSQQIPQWKDIEKLFMAKCFTILENRIVAHLSYNSEERYQFFFQQNPELFNQVPLRYIASMLGMTPETFSRIRKKHSRHIS